MGEGANVWSQKGWGLVLENHFFSCGGVPAGVISHSLPFCVSRIFHNNPFLKEEALRAAYDGEGEEA